MQLNCTDCKATVRFATDGSWARTCSSCQSLVLRSGDRYAVGLPRMAVLPDLSPMAVGSVGSFAGAEFRIVGRMRVEGANGYRNFWSLQGRDLPYRWLVHAYGTYALMAKWPGQFPKSEMRGIKPNRSMKLDDGLDYCAEMLDNSFRFAFEGELMEPLQLPYTIELEAGRAPNDKVIVHVMADAGLEALVGIMVDFEELHFEHSPTWARWI